MSSSTALLDLSHLSLATFLPFHPPIVLCYLYLLVHYFSPFILTHINSGTQIF